MFHNIGAQIKGIAKLICWVGVILSIAMGSYLLNNSDRYHDTTTQGAVVMIAGTVGSLVFALVLYGFGELIERVKSIDEKLSDPKYCSDNEGDDDSSEEVSSAKPN